MSTQTFMYKFVKPDANDPADITAMNKNWDDLDWALEQISLQSAGNKVNLESFQNQIYDNILPSIYNNYQRKIKSGTAAPSGGVSGDIYIQIIE